MIIHIGLQGRWHTFSILFQMANMGVDVMRAVEWREKNDNENTKAAFLRAHELLSFTIADPKNRRRLHELCLVREFLVDNFVFENQHKTTDKERGRYFNSFLHLAVLERGR